VLGMGDGAPEELDEVVWGDGLELKDL
jgi:hypothetical protein